MTEPVKEHQIRGYNVQIRNEGGKEQLWIDGIQHRFFMSNDRFILYDDAYAPSQESLLQAVEAFLDKQPQKD